MRYDLRTRGVSDITESPLFALLRLPSSYLPSTSGNSLPLHIRRETLLEVSRTEEKWSSRRERYNGRVRSPVTVDRYFNETDERPPSTLDRDTAGRGAGAKTQFSGSKRYAVAQSDKDDTFSHGECRRWTSQGEPDERRRGSASAVREVSPRSSVRGVKGREAKYRRPWDYIEEVIPVITIADSDTRSLLSLPLSRCTVRNGIFYVCERRSSDETWRLGDCNLHGGCPKLALFLKQKRASSDDRSSSLPLNLSLSALSNIYNCTRLVISNCKKDIDFYRNLYSHK